MMTKRLMNARSRASNGLPDPSPNAHPRTSAEEPPDTSPGQPPSASRNGRLFRNAHGRFSGNRRLGLSPAERLRGFLTAGHSARMVVFRRAAAVVLVLFAGLLAWQPGIGGRASTVPVLVVAHDLPPGHVVGPDDLAFHELPAEFVPHGALRTRSAAEGRVLGGASRSGEVLTDVRLTGRELTELTVGDGTHASVPIRLADPEVADLLYPGRQVDLVTTGGEPGQHAVLAERAPVIAIRPPGKDADQGRLIVVGLPGPQAAELAAASLIHSVTVTLR